MPLSVYVVSYNLYVSIVEQEGKKIYDLKMFETSINPFDSIKTNGQFEFNLLKF